ncbi:hypothetical protein [Brevundimonas sp.]|uniref:hypothetical protein n=1 Tax=Brevundimonas sp. TaxID=1871086 RepID=UPI0025E8E04E|nr:hypothetical protein [Brevundimonas sp.]
MSRPVFFAAAALACAVAAPAAAQVTGGYPPGTSVAEIEARERAETARLNQAVLDRDAQIVAANEAAAARFAREQAEFEAAQRAHADAQARYRAEVQAVEAAQAAHAAAQARYEAEMAAWRARTSRPY